ncbi:MAG: hypothetical protein IKO36_04700 [Bacteroidaceae bacterium]|nr:hypothetical protein [Bacteroidaceae bacterium]
MESVYTFVSNNIKMVSTIAVFGVGMYVQHEVNNRRIADLEQRCELLDRKLDAQYKKIDEIKLDKNVFEYTVKQIADMSTDIREIRADLKEVLKSK